MSFTFYLGAHQPIWLERSPVPLFVSDVRLRDRKSFPRALEEWGLDSGGFSIVSKFGAWNVTPREYVERVRRYSSEIGKLKFAAPQDWMCEPDILRGNPKLKIKGTGLKISDHIERTVNNFFELRSLAPELPFIPVLQGWTEGDYLDCMELYEKKGLSLKAQPLIGVGSICRRQNTLRAQMWIREWASYGLKLHGFGFKIEGIKECFQSLETADSQAWSFHARRMKISNQDPEADSNSLEQALEWRSGLMEQLTPATQQTPTERPKEEQLKLF